MANTGNWMTNTKNDVIFYKLSVEETLTRNHSNWSMTSRGYKYIATKFELIRGLQHSNTQLKNMWESLKRILSFWLWLNKQTRLGMLFGCGWTNKQDWDMLMGRWWLVMHFEITHQDIVFYLNVFIIQSFCVDVF